MRPVASSETRRPTVFARLALAAVAVIGAALIVFPLATNLFDKTSASDDIINATRADMQQTALDQGDRDMAVLAAMTKQLQTQMLPALATQLRMTPQQFAATLATINPTVARNLGQMDAAVAFVTADQARKVATASAFRDADSIPTADTSPRWVPWLMVIPGILLLAAGVLGLLRPALLRASLAGATIVGLVMVIGLLSTSMYGKSQGASDLVDQWKPMFTTQHLQQGRAYVTNMQAVASEMPKALPAIGAALKMTPAQVTTMLATTYPAVANGIAQLPAILGRIDHNLGIFESQQDNFNRTAEIPWSGSSMTTLYWLQMGGFLLVVVAGLAGLTTMFAVSTRPTGVSHRLRIRPHAH